MDQWSKVNLGAKVPADISGKRRVLAVESRQILPSP
jgi:hypothetical protein